MHVRHRIIVHTELAPLTQKVQVRALRQEHTEHQLLQDPRVALIAVVLLQEVVVQYVVPAHTPAQEVQVPFLQEVQEVLVVRVDQEVPVEEGLVEEDDKPISINFK